MEDQKQTLETQGDALKANETEINKKKYKVYAYLKRKFAEPLTALEAALMYCFPTIALNDITPNFDYTERKNNVGKTQKLYISTSRGRIA